MRPRKKILLIDPDDDRRGEFKFVLEISGYRVVQTARDADLIIARWPIAAGSCEELKTANPDAPLVILHSSVDVLNPRSLMILHSDAVWTASMLRIEMLERIHVMSARKRGPRKGSKYPKSKPPSTEPQPAEVAAIA